MRVSAWRYSQGLEKYGLIAVNAESEAAQVEKVTYETANKLLKTFGTVTSVGPSLGSFSLSGEMLTCLLNEFAAEITGKEAKMDSDPHFWMPLTLSKDAYCSVMVTKEETEAQAGAHHDRMQAFKTKLLAAHPGKGVFGAIDVGENCYWWDYGQLRLYQTNNMLAMDDSEEAAALRDYLKIPEGGIQNSDLGEGCAVKGSSMVLASKIKSGTVNHTIASHVTTGKCEVNDCMLINVTAKSIKANNCIIYNVVDDSEEGLILPDGAVYTNVFVPGREKLVQTSSTTTDGGKVFKVKMTPNPYSFNDVYKMNQSTDVKAAYALGAKAHADLAKKL